MCKQIFRYSAEGKHNVGKNESAFNVFSYLGQKSLMPHSFHVGKYCHLGAVPSLMDGPCPIHAQLVLM